MCLLLQEARTGLLSVFVCEIRTQPSVKLLFWRPVCRCSADCLPQRQHKLHHRQMIFYFIYFLSFSQTPPTPFTHSPFLSLCLWPCLLTAHDMVVWWAHCGHPKLSPDSKCTLISTLCSLHCRRHQLVHLVSLFKFFSQMAFFFLTTCCCILRSVPWPFLFILRS